MKKKQLSDTFVLFIKQFVEPDMVWLHIQTKMDSVAPFWLNRQFLKGADEDELDGDRRSGGS